MSSTGTNTSFLRSLQHRMLVREKLASQIHARHASPTREEGSFALSSTGQTPAALHTNEGDESSDGWNTTFRKGLLRIAVGGEVDITGGAGLWKPRLTSTTPSHMPRSTAVPAAASVTPPTVTPAPTAGPLAPEPSSVTASPEKKVKKHRDVHVFPFQPFRERDLLNQITAKYLPSGGALTHDSDGRGSAAEESRMPNIIIHCCPSHKCETGVNDGQISPAIGTVGNACVPLRESLTQSPVSTIPQAAPQPFPAVTLPPPPSSPLQAAPGAVASPAPGLQVAATQSAAVALMQAEAEARRVQLVVQREKNLLEKANRYVERLEEEVQHRALHLNVTASQLTEEEARNSALRHDRDALMAIGRQLSEENAKLQVAAERALLFNEARVEARKRWGLMDRDGEPLDDEIGGATGVTGSADSGFSLPEEIRIVYDAVHGKSVPEATNTEGTCETTGDTSHHAPPTPFPTEGAGEAPGVADSNAPLSSLGTVEGPSAIPVPLPPGLPSMQAPVPPGMSPEGYAQATRTIEAQVLKHVLLSREEERRAKEVLARENEKLREELVARSPARHSAIPAADAVGSRFSSTRLDDLERYVNHLLEEAQCGAAQVRSTLNETRADTSYLGPAAAKPIQSNAPTSMSDQVWRRIQLEQLQNDVAVEGLRMEQEASRWRAFLQAHKSANAL